MASSPTTMVPPSSSSSAGPPQQQQQPTANLPAKKRKASNASQSSNNTATSRNSLNSKQEEPGAGGSGDALNDDDAAQAPAQVSTSTTMTATATSKDAPATTRSLPSKKRKSSLSFDHNIEEGQQDGGSGTASASVPSPRKWSQDSSSSFRLLPSKKRRGSSLDNTINSNTSSNKQAASGSKQGSLQQADATSGGVSFALDDSIRLRKGSQDSSLGSFESTAHAALGGEPSSRKCSDTTATNTINSLNYSHCSSNSNAKLPPALLDDDDLLLSPANMAASASAGELSASGGGGGAPSTAQQVEGDLPASSLVPSLETLPSDLDALDHLDALGLSAPAPGAIATTTTTTNNSTANNTNNNSPTTLPISNTAKRKGSDATDNSCNSYASSGQRLLLEAIMMTTSSSQHSGGGGGGAALAHHSASYTGAPVPAVGTAAGPTTTGGGANFAVAAAASARDRLESWGGMSDLSIPHNPLDDEHAARLLGVPSSSAVAAATTGSTVVPSRISLQRDRLNSVASLSEVSITLPMLFDSTSAASSSDAIVVNPSDLQAYVAAAVASVGDQLAELAGALEMAAFTTDSLNSLDGDPITAAAAAVPATVPNQHKQSKSTTVVTGRELESETSSVASPMIGAVSDAGRGGRSTSAKGASGRPRSWSTCSEMISVDYEAVQAAVHAAAAATSALDLTTISGACNSASAVHPDVAKSNKTIPKKPTAAKDTAERKSRIPRRKLPMKRQNSSSSGANNKKSEEARNRRSSSKAKKKPPPSDTYKTAPPLKKRAKRNSPEPEKPQSSSSLFQQTPKVSNRSVQKNPPPTAHCLPLAVPSSATVEESSAAVKGPANQKWDQMLECMLQFAEDRRQEETKGMTEKEKEEWVWDGNVPTSYKSKDGKALGRWVNNQRSAKSKGTLKDDREKRLVESGLKWSVMTSNSWNEMLDELSIYAQEQTKSGLKWDGNVPTNYQIKTRPNSHFQGEDKNLGRWVNRQRSMYMAGRLRKDRQVALEKLGLKWSMLSTTSWDAMYDTLCEYAENSKKGGKEWDGNVPANFKTSDNPPKALGRWINRQRSAYTKKKLKREYIDKLNELGLKWSVHERGKNGEENVQPDDGSDSDATESPEIEETEKEVEKDNNSVSKVAV